MQLHFTGKFILLEIGLCASAAMTLVVISFCRSMKQIVSQRNSKKKKMLVEQTVDTGNLSKIKYEMALH